MRIVDALKARNQLAPVHDPASEDQRQARRERQAAQHARAIVSIDGRDPAGSNFGVRRHWIEDESTDGDFYRLFGGDPHVLRPRRDQYYVAQDGMPIMLERCTNPSSRAELEQMQARKQQRRLEREAAAKERRGTDEGGRGAVSEYIYTARLVPLGKPVRIPVEDGGPVGRLDVHDKSFEIERTSKTKPEIWVDHDRALRIGNVAMLYTSRDWWCCDFMLDRDIPDDIEFEVGQPVMSASASSRSAAEDHSSGKSASSSRGAVKGAEITERYEIKPTAPPRRTNRRPRPRSDLRRPAHPPQHRPGDRGRRAAALRTNQGDPIRYIRGDIVIDRADGTQEIYCGREGHAEAIRNGVLTH